MYSKISLLLACFVLSLLIGAAPSPSTQTTQKRDDSKTNKAQGPNYSVNVSKVLERTTAENTVVYQISYSYDFKERKSVYVKGLGTVLPKGQFSYMVPEPLLEFRESLSGPVITTVQLEETFRTQGGESTEFLDEKKFPTFFRSDIWSPPATFPLAAIKVVNKYFPSGHNSTQDGQLNKYITTFRNLQVPNPKNDREITNLRSQIAIILSQPYDPAQDRFTYRIQYLARDRPRMSTTWRYGDDRNKATIESAQGFLNTLIAELNAGKGAQK
jgi:hypothetical protein